MSEPRDGFESFPAPAAPIPSLERMTEALHVLGLPCEPPAVKHPAAFLAGVVEAAAAAWEAAALGGGAGDDFRAGWLAAHGGDERAVLCAAAFQASDASNIARSMKACDGGDVTLIPLAIADRAAAVAAWALALASELSRPGADVPQDAGRYADHMFAALTDLRAQAMIADDLMKLVSSPDVPQEGGGDVGQ